MKKQVSKDIQDKIVYNYTILNKGIAASGKEFGLGMAATKTILKDNGVKIRTQQESAVLSNKNRAKKINHDYFKTESSNMAYILGLLASDGTVRKNINEIKLTLNEDDSEILERIKTELQFEGNIRHYEDSKGFKNATIAFTSAEIKKDLSKYNIVPQKTFTFIFPTILKKQYWIDFIRGYFDGDGSINATAQGLRWQVCSATNNVLQVIVDFFYDEYNIPKVKIQSQQRSQNTLYTIQYSTNATKKIFDILYTPNSLYLKRKYDKFVSIVK